MYIGVCGCSMSYFIQFICVTCPGLRRSAVINWISVASQLTCNTRKMAKRSRAIVEEESEYEEEYESDASFTLSSKKRATKSATTRKRQPKKKAKSELPDMPAALLEAVEKHPVSRHIIANAAPLRSALLEWYSGVHEARGMPWRKPYDPTLGPEERAQRAYEVWPSCRPRNRGY